MEEKPQSLDYTGHFPELVFAPFYPRVEKYCLKKDIPFNILLLLNNTLGHPPFMDDFHPSVYLPPNTMSVIQPVDQGVIVTFKKYYSNCTFCQTIKASDISGTTLQQFWKGCTTYKPIKTLTLLGVMFSCHHDWDLEEPLPTICSSFFMDLRWTKSQQRSSAT